MLPLVVRKVDDTVYSELVEEYIDTYGEEPSVEQKNAWKKLVSLLDGIEFPSVWEYPISDGRADIIFTGKDRALVVEAKGWRRVKKVDMDIVEADGQLHLDPCYQLTDYVTKLNFFHSSGVKFYGLLFLYNTSDYSSECKTIREIDELKDELKSMAPGDPDTIVKGKLRLNKTFVDFVETIKERKQEDLAKALLPYGYGLSEKQAIILKRVMDALERGERKNFLIRGNSGSGKSLLAVTIFLEGLSRGYFSFLSYVNNRLLNVVRQALGHEVSTFIRFYSTGIKGYPGIGEEGFEDWFRGQFGERQIDLIVFDEAQRMREDVIRRSPKGRVNVYFYDDQQVLLDNEAGTRENFLKHLKDVEEYDLYTVLRAPKDYVEFVRSILEGRPSHLPDFEFRVFSDIEDMLRELGKKKEEGRRVALVCAFTESDRGLRIGYPLPSGLDLYKSKDVRVTWLMDPKTEYPRYWTGKLDPLKYCSSVYGAQGFDAEYVGVVWGRDFVWRDGGGVDF
ncbi:DNA/RNA helicase domain-containing protein [Stygiolobus caldivivus]|uniref:Schlafen group 3-like DNA/RNA helicase domain-containing protein n=1 Tax=Stygiolobus caldivivus TaxID=2824673 RepID=A0A8D5U8T8_9CREN|nr:DNA/RNA helicase domain-containing protein [Stygiolobus caldivivus]BCU71524.1 hypothetical protein KN1_28210 [Stygiolobus caldivivus]